MSKIDAAKRQLHHLETSRSGTSLERRAELAGRISELQTYLGFARAASPVTTALDLALGTYTVSEDDPYHGRRVGVLGATLWTLTICGGLAPGVVAQSASLVGAAVNGVVAQSASLVGAAVKATVRLAAKGPAKTANVIAQRNYVRNAR